MMQNTSNLSGKTALVTGGSRGIGAAIVRRLSSEGAKVAFTYAASSAAADELVNEVTLAGGTALAIKADSADAYAFTCLDFEKTAVRFGRLGGFAHLKTLIDRLRNEAGSGRALLLDGGDLWQGTGQANATQGADMVDAANLLGSNDDAKLVAGGMTLIPTLKQRLARPSDLIDLAAISDLKGIKREGNAIVVGAMTRHAEVATSDVVKGAIPALAQLAEGIGDPQVRNRGTIGGSIANNDPNADYPAALLGLGATIITNKRRIVADDFFQGMFTTALEEGEIIVKVSFPIAKKAAYVKFKHPASGFALVGVFVSKRGPDIRVAVTGAGANGVFRVKSFEEALKKRFAAKSIEGMTVPATGMNSDIHASAEYRAHLIGVLARRALARASI